MIKDKAELEDRGVEIDLSGPEGNAFALMGTARSLCKQLGWDVDEIIDDMMSGDYEHLLSVMEKHFGSVITMYR